MCMRGCRDTEGAVAAAGKWSTSQSEKMLRSRGSSSSSDGTSGGGDSNDGSGGGSVGGED